MAKSRVIVEARSGLRAPPGWTLQLELVNCGRCKGCNSHGNGHGPYWYAYVEEHGKTRSVYIGRELPEFNLSRRYTFRGMDRIAKVARRTDREGE